MEETLVVLPVSPPVKPMLASPVDQIPRRAGMLFEPKWDGFRCLVFIDPPADEPVTLQSRSGKPLNRYFPEVINTITEGMDRPIVLDGELVVVRSDEHGDRLDWDALGERIHPAASRVRTLAERTPAQFIAFDLLALDGDDLCSTGFSDRRDLLSGHADHGPQAGVDLQRLGIAATPATDDPDTALEWWRLFEGAGLDGVIGKDANSTYQPGNRAMIKIKHNRSADCVVAGLRWHANTEPGTAVGSLLLGLYDDSGVLHHVGVVGAFSAKTRRQLADELAGSISDTGHPWLGPQAEDGRRLPGAINRWRSTEQPWQPLPPDRVIEVSYDHTEGAHPSRFRHTTQFVRWRPDRDPSSCRYDQLDEPARYDLDAVLRGKVSG